MDIAEKGTMTETRQIKGGGRDQIHGRKGRTVETRDNADKGNCTDQRQARPEIGQTRDQRHSREGEQ
jgi:hypothetical protein